MNKPKKQWIDEVFKLICKSQGEPENDNERKNLLDWATSLADEESGYFQDGMTPEEAHQEELSCA